MMILFRYFLRCDYLFRAQVVKHRFWQRRSQVAQFSMKLLQHRQVKVLDPGPHLCGLRLFQMAILIS